SLLGASLAVPLAFWTSRLLGSTVWAGAEVPLARSMTPDLLVLALAASLTVATGLLLGLVSGWLATRQRVRPLLQTSPTTTMPMPRMGRVLLVAQVALSLVLVTGAVLLAKTITHLRANIVALPAQHIVWTRLWSKPGSRGTALGAAYYSELAR